MTRAATGYWVDLYHEEKRLGAGFLLTRNFVLTALHCLRGAGGLDGRLDIALADGGRVPARVRRTADEADLALVEIDDARQITLPLPLAQVAPPGARWRSPYRPFPSDVALSGQVNHRTRHLCEAGGTIEALQLTVDQQLGDYSGYSGGPVEGADDRGGPFVLGILLEQALSRDPGGGPRAANVLFAATIAEAMRRFDDYFGVAHLVDVLRPATGRERRAEPPDGGHGPGTGGIAEAESLLVAFRQWVQRGLIDPVQATELSLDVARRLIEKQLGAGGRDAL
ncbi:serine protease [Streptomyces sp. MP131-18]|uniref:S1 family peptidase n=1 Tax=Streptomyces sp. MP131-18 TaxID=1857892 RepID=UPI00097C5B8E|nr:serine protease [Streptomyces sp. MP131-18]ONK12592.1 hypothetical protein STBA_33400 [Streptomyces sp. MP131-18]